MSEPRRDIRGTTIPIARLGREPAAASLDQENACVTSHLCSFHNRQIIRACGISGTTVKWSMAFPPGLPRLRLGQRVFFAVFLSGFPTFRVLPTTLPGSDPHR